MTHSIKVPNSICGKMGQLVFGRKYVTCQKCMSWLKANKNRKERMEKKVA